MKTSNIYQDYDKTEFRSRHAIKFKIKNANMTLGTSVSIMQFDTPKIVVNEI